MIDPREQFIAKMEGRKYFPTANNDSTHTALNGAEIDAYHLESFDAWVQENKIDIARLMGLLKTRSTTATKPSALEDTTSYK